MTEVDTYLARVQDTWQRDELNRFRKVISAAAPTATQQISYGMPAFKYKNRYLIGYCNFKDHVSIFPGAEVIAALSKDLAGFTTKKGTIQSTESQIISDELLTRIVALRIADIDAA